MFKKSNGEADGKKFVVYKLVSGKLWFAVGAVGLILTYASSNPQFELLGRMIFLIFAIFIVLSIGFSEIIARIAGKEVRRKGLPWSSEHPLEIWIEK